VGSCHHGTARPQVAVGRDGLQIRREAVFVLKGSGGQRIRDDPPACVLDKGLKLLTVKKADCYEMLKQGLGVGGLL